MTFNDKLQAYLQLTRFDKPVGIELLLWPTLWGVMLAAMGQAQQQGASAGLSSLKMLVIFALGAIFMWRQVARSMILPIVRSMVM